MAWDQRKCGSLEAQKAMENMLKRDAEVRSAAKIKGLVAINEAKNVPKGTMFSKSCDKAS